MEASCDTCRFWQRFTVPPGGVPSDEGTCRYNPPLAFYFVEADTLGYEEPVITYFPQTFDCEWCGKYEKIRD